ncbi:MAG: LptF/LptG family permease, partial [Pyrinomonadaceae bacterium]
VLISIVIILAYYLLFLFGEQTARSGKLPPVIGCWIANVFTLGLGIFSASNISFSITGFMPRFSLTSDKSEEKKGGTLALNLRKRLSTGLQLVDRTTFFSLLTWFAATFFVLTSLFMIFTVFELWKFIILNQSGASLVLRYVFYLLPLISVSVAAPSLLVSVLLTYATMTRRRELVAWWASGRSLYRLAIPGLVFALTIGLCIWIVQEKIMPTANLKQDSLRNQIRNGVSTALTSKGRQWLASADGKRIYSYDFDTSGRVFKNLNIYDLNQTTGHIEKVIHGSEGIASDNGFITINKYEEISFGEPITRRVAEQMQIPITERTNDFKVSSGKPSQLSSSDLSAYINVLKDQGVTAPEFAAALARKHAEPFIPLVMALLSIPLAVSFGRSNAIAVLALSVVTGIVFWGLTNAFQQFGSYGLLAPQVAPWIPLIGFGAISLYLFSHART